MQRLKVMKLEDVKEIKEGSSKYYKKPELYALDRFCYYPCVKCGKPYFGGEKACDVVRDFNPNELICTACTPGARDECKTHGKEYIQYKCKFCCKTACWYCWGTTHFCDDCHKQASVIAAKKKEELPKCTCQNPNHPQPGVEHCFGCSICVTQQEF